MKVSQAIVRATADAGIDAIASRTAPLVLVFGSVERLGDPDLLAAVTAAFPRAVIAGCSTAGEIASGGLHEGTAVITAVELEATRVESARAIVQGVEGSRSAGEQVGGALAAPDLRGVLVFGKGLSINGSALIDGVASRVGPHVSVSGGLAGDGGAFKRTLVLSAHGASDDGVVAVGLYGDHVRFGHGSYGGWTPFGPARRVTRCEGSILHELDGEPALNVYRRYLGDYARDLPASGLLFPFEMLDSEQGNVGLVRTILGVDDLTGSLTLAGAVDPNGFLRLMHADADALIAGAEQAAQESLAALAGRAEGLALLVSCVGRKLVMGDRVDDELSAVSSHLGAGFTLAGFYSYGEINPMNGGLACRLHNQTMTIALVTEA